MSKKIITIFAIVLVILILGAFIVTQKDKPKNENNNLKIVSSFYPIHVITMNLTENAQNVEAICLTQKNVGCLHDYTLSTTDMKKFENANIFIQNGLGLEEFMNKIIESNQNLKIINSSKEISNTIKDGENINPHIWTSIENYIKQVQTIASELCSYNPENSLIYTKNCESYVQALNELKKEYDAQLSHLKSQKAICLDEALIYLSNSIGIETTYIQTNHEESTLSADEIKNIINKMKNENIKLILVNKENNMNNAQTLAKETGAQIIKLNSLLTGENNKDDYLNGMLENLEILKKINLNND